MVGAGPRAAPVVVRLVISRRDGANRNLAAAAHPRPHRSPRCRGCWRLQGLQAIGVPCQPDEDSRSPKAGGYAKSRRVGIAPLGATRPCLRLERVRQAQANDITVRPQPHLVVGPCRDTPLAGDCHRFLRRRAISRWRAAEPVAASFGNSHDDVWLGYLHHAFIVRRGRGRRYRRLSVRFSIRDNRRHIRSES